MVTGNILAYTFNIGTWKLNNFTFWKSYIRKVADIITNLKGLHLFYSDIL
jgi:hypothetical protein